MTRFEIGFWSSLFLSSIALLFHFIIQELRKAMKQAEIHARKNKGKEEQG